MCQLDVGSDVEGVKIQPEKTFIPGTDCHLLLIIVRAKPWICVFH